MTSTIPSVGTKVNAATHANATVPGHVPAWSATDVVAYPEAKTERPCTSAAPSSSQPTGFAGWRVLTRAPTPAYDATMAQISGGTYTGVSDGFGNSTTDPTPQPAATAPASHTTAPRTPTRRSTRPGCRWARADASNMAGILGRCRPVNVTGSRYACRAVPYPSMSPPTPSGTSARWLEIRVLGPLEVSVDGVPLIVDTRKALAILALLAVEDRAFARDELAAMLWPESDDESARGALRRTLSVLRSAVGERGIRVDRSSVALDGSASWVDVRVVEAATSSRERSTLLAAAALARGPLLAGFSLRDSVEFDEWRATRATAVERTVSTLLDRLADVLEGAGDHAAAAAAAARRLD